VQINLHSGNLNLLKIVPIAIAIPIARVDCIEWLRSGSVKLKCAYVIILPCFAICKNVIARRRTRL